MNIVIDESWNLISSDISRHTNMSLATMGHVEVEVVLGR